GALILSIALAAGAPAARSEDAPLKLSLGYEGRLIFKVLDIQVEQHATASGFSSSANLTSAGILAALKHIHQRASSQGRIVGGEPRPGTSETQNLSGKTHRKIHTVWSDGEVVMNADPPYANLGDPPPSPGQKLAAADPLTELMRMTIRGSPEANCGRTHMFF